MGNQKRVTSIGPAQKKPIKNSSQVYLISSGIKAKKAAGACGSCGKRKLY